MSIRRLAAVLAAAALAVTACGGDDDEPTATSDDTSAEDSDNDDDQPADDDPADDIDDDTEPSDTDEPSDDTPDFDDVDWDALSQLGFDAQRCLELSVTAGAVASLPLAIFADEEGFDIDEANAQIDEMISDLPDEFHPELRYVHALINEARGYTLTDPNNPIVRPGYSAAWDSYFDKLDAACDYDQ
ncbi:hypothetical protein [Phytoactinopolyspora limicola]|uniref:hypothetical protein n=1 Tax=Phytoactinopolyspora limicola TaxID=2715536 RepID=UPI001409C578|nr:hypothetical protein [Phytoactinopolyspora limicola]